MSQRVIHRTASQSLQHVLRSVGGMPRTIVGSVGWLLLLAVLPLLLGPDHARAASLSTAAVTGATAVPPGFVPDWDGHTDSSVITYHLLARSRVRVVVVDQQGVVVRELVNATLPAGAHSTWWDGRAGDGSVLAEGGYLVRTYATVLAPAPDEPQEPGSGGTTVTSGSQDVLVTLRRSTVAIRNVRLSRGSIGAVRAASATRISFRMTAGGRVAAVIVDDRGRVRRNIFRGTIKAGPASLVWNGRDDAGAPLPDGSYRLLLAATAGAMPSMTLRTTLRIDRTPPRVVLPPRLVATSSRTSVSVGVVLFLSEAATVRLRVGGRMLDTSLPAGRSRLMLKGASLGLGPLSARRSLRLVAVASDATGNATVDRAQLQVAAAPPGPIRPPDRPGGHGPGGNPGPPVTSSRMLWPVPGAINSPFGMRTLNGVTRPHEGLDLNARSGDPIRAAAAGSIIYQGNRMDGYGNLVIVQHANGMTTRYAHQSAFPTAQVIGDRVRRGQVIGYVGCTGSCFGDHLHFEVRINEIAVDPRSYLQVR